MITIYITSLVLVTFMGFTLIYLVSIEKGLLNDEEGSDINNTSMSKILEILDDIEQNREIKIQVQTKVSSELAGLAALKKSIG